MKELDRLRKNIDKLDDEILALLNRRSEIVIEVGNIKRTNKSRFYKPDRERQILERLTSRNKGPFPTDALKAIYREILSASVSLEEPLKVSCLGPLGTFTHLAALRHFGSSSAFVPVDSIKKVFENVESGKAEYGVVPIENSNEGVVSYTLDMFMDSDLKVVAEIILNVSHNLVSKQTDRAKIKKIYSHPQALAQCDRFLRSLAGVDVVATYDTAGSARLIRDRGLATAAAIASARAAEVFGLDVVQAGIQDHPDNITRFLIVGRGGGAREVPGADKTTIVFTLPNVAGALFKALSVFALRDIDLTKLESRPIPGRPWEYLFYADIAVGAHEERCRRSLVHLAEFARSMRTLGSYPAWRREGTGSTADADASVTP